MTIAADYDSWRPRDTLAARFKLLRGELGMSQREFAMATGIPVAQVQSIEDGKSPRGLDVKVKKVVEAFRVDRDWLMWGGELANPDTTGPGGGGQPQNGDDELPRLDSNQEPSDSWLLEEAS